MTGGPRTRRGAAAVALTAWACALLPGAATAAGPPDLQAGSAIVVDAADGEVLYRRAPDRERQIASTTKLMTALIALERVSLRDVLTSPGYEGAPAETRIGLRPGERMAVRDLLRALLLPSANDAAVTLAEGIAGSRARFVRLMNRRARELGLHHTRFSNPIGLDDPDNHSSAADLATLARLLLRRPFFADTVDRSRARLRTGKGDRTVVSRNRLLGQVRWVDGVKTGHTSQAGYVLVGSATRRGVKLVSAVLGDPSEAARDADTLALLRWGFTRYRRQVLLRSGRVLARPPLRHRDSDRVPLVAARSVARVLRRGQRPRISLDAPKNVEGPLAAGARVGTARVSLRGKVIARVPLVTARAVPSVSLPERAARWVLSPVPLLVLFGLGGASLTLAMVRRHRRRRDRSAGATGSDE